MPLKMVIFMIGFAFACVGGLAFPTMAIIGYVLHYHISPESQWWGSQFVSSGLRGSFLLAISAAIGTTLNFRKLRYGNRFFLSQEWLILLFLGLVWFSTLLHPTDTATFAGLDPPAVKMTKIVIFVMLLTHVITTAKRLDWLLWALVVGVLFLGYQAFSAGSAAFSEGRLNGIGGPDFRESNGLATYLAACLPLIGIQFLRSGWKGKLLCLASGALAADGIVLTRSRGGLVGLSAGLVMAILFMPKRDRKPIVAGIIAMLIGVFLVTDAAFWTRARTITAEQETRDNSAQSRLDVWAAAPAILKDHPLGLGAGNFQSNIGEYLQDHAGVDAHNTYVLCASELGVPGVALFLLLIANAFRMLWRTYKRAAFVKPEMATRLYLVGYALALSLTVFLVCCVTMSRLYTEATWWLLALPVCLARVTDNAVADGKARPETPQGLPLPEQALGKPGPAAARSAGRAKSPRRRPASSRPAAGTDQVG